MKKEKVILAYSSGLDTSVILKWLCNKRQMEITLHENTNIVAHGI